MNPAITGGSAVVNKLNGQPVTDPFGQPGFPGFDGLFATTTLGYVAQMQEAGIPVTYGYISDTHDQHGVAGEIHATRGPGEADYVQQLKDYDAAFASFFERLAKRRDRQEQHALRVHRRGRRPLRGSQPSPAGCDGVNVPCTYPLVGEVNGNLAGLLATQGGNHDAVHGALGHGTDDLPHGQPEPHCDLDPRVRACVGTPLGGQPVHEPVGEPERRARRPGRDEGAAHGHRRPAADADAHDVRAAGLVPVRGRAELLRRRVSPFRRRRRRRRSRGTTAGSSPRSPTPGSGMVGPGVRHDGNDTTWIDHTDVRPTMLSLLGLQDTYAHDGRVLIDQLDASAVPQTLRAHRETLRRLGEVYKQLNAPFGEFGSSLLLASTKAVKSGTTTDDATYTRLEDGISSLTTARDALAGADQVGARRRRLLGQALNEQQAKGFIADAQSLIDRAATLASS